MDTFVTTFIGELFCQYSNFFTQYTFTTLEAVDALKMSILRNIPDSINQNFIINGKYSNGEWIANEGTAIPIKSALMPLNPSNLSCAALSFDGENFNVKSIDCFTRSKTVCEYISLDPPVTSAPSQPITDPNFAPYFHVCDDKSVFSSYYNRGDQIL